MRGIILVGHGSREPYNKDVITYFANRLKEKYEYVGYAFMQINTPSIKDALLEAVNKGVKEIVVQPVFLTRGIHVDYDIPEILNMPPGVKKAILEYSGKKIRVFLGEPIGRDDRLLEILIDRIEEALKD
ncbi:MAG: sirohydrochlorin nickelochelatase [Candidatus Methanomethyliaceae archaeon]|nr:sirohydrochlorin nickelochelatase [Candidatus Methanomethyliaceae archaeon]MDW7970411.1 sirohydrochlorin nickelochelatase [Nitrososphaerota archaeon]